MENQINIDEIEIEIRLNPKGEMLAQAQLSYRSLKIKGYRIMKSTYAQEGIYIVPPSAKAGTGWIKLVRFEDPELWSKIENKILNDYQNTEKNTGNSDSELQNGVKNGENSETSIPFEPIGDEVFN
jgi:hypothetical protein